MMGCSLGFVPTLGLLVSVGTIDTAVGTRNPGFCDAPVSEAMLPQPLHRACDADGNVWIAEDKNHGIRKPDLKTGKPPTIVGTGKKGYDSDGGPSVKARLDRPRGRCDDPADTFLSSADSNNYWLRRVRLK
jgi:hypothetical protein